MKAFFFAGSLLLALAAHEAAAQLSPAGLEAALKRRAAASQHSTPTTALGVPDQNKAQATAEMVYNTWRLSMIRGSEQSWRSSTSASRQVKIRNMIVSQRGNFPRDFFSKPQNPPQLENFRFVGALTGCNGRTMAATYVGRLQLGNAPAHENAYVLELVLEGGKWKLDQTRFFDLSRLPEVRKKLHARDLGILKEQDGFHPYDRIPPIPPACQPPVLIGKVFVDCPGRSIEMTINGVSLHSFDDERRADVISGGLKRGKNTISYTIRGRDGRDKPSLGIGLFVMPETPGNTPVCVFDHLLDAQGEAQGGSFTFSIDNEHIASMNPQFKGTKPVPFHVVPLKPAPQKK